MLYRGVNKKDDETNSGKIIPKGNVEDVVPLMDGKWKADGKFKFGPCKSNTARAHQIETGLYGACAVSTSRSEMQAIKFATSGYLEEGYIYVIDESVLESLNIVPHEFSDPLYPEEIEVTLVLKSNDPIPDIAIVEKYEVSSDGKRT